MPDDPTDIEALRAELRSGPYGRCVWDSDNDVVSQNCHKSPVMAMKCDNQTVMLEFDNGVSATLTMIAFTEKVLPCHLVRLLRNSSSVSGKPLFMAVKANCDAMTIVESSILRFRRGGGSAIRTHWCLTQSPAERDPL